MNDKYWQKWKISELSEFYDKINFQKKSAEVTSLPHALKETWGIGLSNAGSRKNILIE